MEFNAVEREINQADQKLSNILDNAKIRAQTLLADPTQEEQKQHALLDQ
jgi:F0F1-type ATP synthase membrane subunit b/b'